MCFMCVCVCVCVCVCICVTSRITGCNDCWALVFMLEYCFLIQTFFLLCVCVSALFHGQLCASRVYMCFMCVCLYLRHFTNNRLQQLLLSVSFYVRIFFSIQTFFLLCVCVCVCVCVPSRATLCPVSIQATTTTVERKFCVRMCLGGFF